MATNPLNRGSRRGTDIGYDFTTQVRRTLFLGTDTHGVTVFKELQVSAIVDVAGSVRVGSYTGATLPIPSKLIRARLFM